MLALPLELALVMTAGVLANLTMRKKDQELRDSMDLIDWEERIRQELEERFERLEKLGLSAERLAEEKLLALQVFDTRRNAIRNLSLQSVVQKEADLRPARLEPGQQLLEP